MLLYVGWSQLAIGTGHDYDAVFATIVGDDKSYAGSTWNLLNETRLNAITPKALNELPKASSPTLPINVTG